MTDAEIGQALAEANALERRARAHWQTATTIGEQQAALLVVRHATAVVKALKDWLGARAEALAS